MTENGLYQVMQYAHPFDANPKISEIVEWYEAEDIYFDWLEKAVFSWDDEGVSYEEKRESEIELIRIEEVTEND